MRADAFSVLTDSCHISRLAERGPVLGAAGLEAAAPCCYGGWFAPCDQRMSWHVTTQLLSSRRGQADPALARVPKTASKAIGSTDSAGDPGLGAKLASHLEQRILFPGLHPTICKFQKAHLFPLCLLAGVWFFSLHYKAIVFSLYYKAE